MKVRAPHTAAQAELKNWNLVLETGDRSKKRLAFTKESLRQAPRYKKYVDGKTIWMNEGYACTGRTARLSEGFKVIAEGTGMTLKWLTPKQASTNTNKAPGMH